RCSLECRDWWARKMALCLQRSFRDLPPTHEARVTVFGLISDRELSRAVGRFLRRLKYRLRGSGWEYLLVNEWSDGHRHMHLLVRTGFDLIPAVIRELWAKTLPAVPFTHHCGPVRTPAAIAKYLVKDLADDSKKELPRQNFRGRIFSYSKRFFTKKVA